MAEFHRLVRALKDGSFAKSPMGSTYLPRRATARGRSPGIATEPIPLSRVVQGAMP